MKDNLFHLLPLQSNTTDAPPLFSRADVPLLPVATAQLLRLSFTILMTSIIRPVPLPQGPLQRTFELDYHTKNIIR